jgi:hypothetical protein
MGRTKGLEEPISFKWNTNYYVVSVSVSIAVMSTSSGRTIYASMADLPKCKEVGVSPTATALQKRRVCCTYQFSLEVVHGLAQFSDTNNHGRRWFIIVQKFGHHVTVKVNVLKGNDKIRR